MIGRQLKGLACLSDLAAELLLVVEETRDNTEYVDTDKSFAT